MADKASTEVDDVATRGVGSAHREITPVSPLSQTSRRGFLKLSTSDQHRESTAIQQQYVPHHQQLSGLLWPSQRSGWPLPPSPGPGPIPGLLDHSWPRRRRWRGAQLRRCPGVQPTPRPNRQQDRHPARPALPPRIHRTNVVFPRGSPPPTTRRPSEPHHTGSRSARDDRTGLPALPTRTADGPAGESAGQVRGDG